MKPRTKKTCDKCNKEISISNFNKHYRSCKTISRKITIDKQWKIDDDKYKCPYCNKEYTKMGICSHILFKHLEIKKDNGFNSYNKKLKSKEISQWNKGLTKKTDERVKKYGESLKKSIKEGKITPSFKGKIHTTETREKMSISAKSSEKHIGWQSRKIKSYPEKYFISILKGRGIFNECINEYHISNGKINYFLDFYFPDKKIDLEIDGSQHEQLERKKSDKIRDKFLSEKGIKVFRIKWKNPKTVDGKEYLQDKINEFMRYWC